MAASGFDQKGPKPGTGARAFMKDMKTLSDLLHETGTMMGFQKTGGLSRNSLFYECFETLILRASPAS
jgi:hypothetical protein